MRKAEGMKAIVRGFILFCLPGLYYLQLINFFYSIKPTLAHVEKFMERDDVEHGFKDLVIPIEITAEARQCEEKLDKCG